MQIPSIKDGIHDAFIGVIIALVSIPISMGYASVAGLPVVYGLYGSLLPILIFAFVSSSPRFVFGVDAAPAAIVGGMIAAWGINSDSAAASSIIPLITLFVALWLGIFFLLRADRIINFISEPVMGGFISGISTTIILMQIPKLFGGSATHGEGPELLLHIVRQAESCFNLPSLILGLGTVLILLLARKICPKVPMQALLMFLGAGIFWIFEDRLGELGIATLPAVTKGLPKLYLPDFSLVFAHPRQLIIDTAGIAIVILSETLLASENLSRKHKEKIIPRREVAAYALGNLSAALTGTCPINGSISRSGIADQFGVKSQVMSITASVSMALILLLGTGFISYLPVPVLTGIVIAALIGTLEFRLAHKLKHLDRAEFYIFYAAFFAVLIFGTIYGVVVGVILATVTFILRVSKPASDFLGIVPGIKGYYSLTRRNTQAKPLKGVVIYRFSAPLFYANIEQFCSDIRKACGLGSGEAEGAIGAQAAAAANAGTASDSGRIEPVRLVVVDSSGISSVDGTASERLLSLYIELLEAGIKLILAGHVASVNDQLREFGARVLIEEKAVRPRILYALRDAGFTPPYTAEDVENISPHADSKPEESLYNPDFSTYEKNEYTEHIAEIEWAYGEESEAILAELAKKMPQSEQSELEQEIYFEELAMLNPEMAKQVADIISEMENTICEKASGREA